MSEMYSKKPLKKYIFLILTQYPKPSGILLVIALLLSQS